MSNINGVKIGDLVYHKKLNWADRVDQIVRGGVNQNPIRLKIGGVWYPANEMEPVPENSEVRDSD